MSILRSLTFDDVLLVPNFGNESRDDGCVETELGTYKYSIPIVSANMDTITGVKMAVAMSKLGGLGLLHRFQSITDNVNMYVEATISLGGYNEVGVSIGVDDQERAEALYKVGARIFCVDVAHAHCKRVGKMVKALKTCDDVFIIAGNVATYSGADYLSSVGADVIKVGIGAGSVCTTREVTGFGVPQFTAIMDCARIDKPIIADGGIRVPGDAVKALAAGATMVMLGGMLSGTNEACGEAGTYRGMASKEAREDYYRTTVGWRAAEGISIAVKPKGPAADVINEVVGGIKSGLSYAGAKNLSELRRKANFIEITPATTKEGTPHGA
jgi:IMP dehydrogenase